MRAPGAPLDAPSAPEPGSCLSAPLVGLLLALVGGMLIERFLLPGTLTGWWLLAAAAWMGWLGCWWAGRLRAGCGLLLTSVLATGAAWHHAWWRLYPDHEFSLALGAGDHPVCLEGIALTGPRVVPAPPPSPLRTIPPEERTTLWVEVRALREEARFRPATGRVQVTVAGRLPGLHAGDRLRLWGLARRVERPLNPGEPDLQRLARGQRCLAQVYVESPEGVQVRARGSAWSWRRLIGRLREAGQQRLAQWVPPRQSRLASALLLGVREQLDAEQREAFLVTGTVHLLCVSGLHVGIVAGGVFLVLRLAGLPRVAVGTILLGVVLLYALVTDANPPVVRASVLVLGACAAWLLHRPAESWNTLAAAALVVLAIHPASLFQVGTQLSFLAVGTLLACRPLLTPPPLTDPLDRLIAASRPWGVRVARAAAGWLWRTWLTGAVIWLVAMPLVWQRFHLLNPVALALNFLIWVPASVALHGGMASLILGGLWPAVGRLCAAICAQCLAVLERCVALGDAWPGGHVWLPAPPAWWVALFYGGAGAVVLLPRGRPPARWLLGLALGWLAGGLLLAGSRDGRLFRPASDRVVCHFIAVGHGVSVLVELPDGRTLLYDAGRLGMPDVAVRAISGVLWSRGLRHLDAVVLSHADVDHFNALPGLLERFSVGVVYAPPSLFDRRAPAVQALHDAITRSGVPLRWLWTGRALDAGAVRLRVLHPPPEGVPGSDNANSLVLLLEHAGRRLLLTGDLEGAGLDALLRQPHRDCDVVLAPHHGSPRSHPRGLAAWCRPETVIISGPRNLRSREHLETVRQAFRPTGAEVLHTAEDGCVRVELRAAGVRVRPFCVREESSRRTSPLPAQFAQAP